VIVRGVKNALLGRKVVRTGSYFNHYGSVYHKFVVHASAENENTKIMQDEDSHIGLQYCCLLPFGAGVDINKRGYYFVVTKNWGEMNAVGEIQKPQAALPPHQMYRRVYRSSAWFKSRNSVQTRIQLATREVCKHKV